MASARSQSHRRSRHGTDAHDSLQRMAPSDAREAPRNVILQGDALAVLRELPDGCVQVCVTSPPYYGLRSYQTSPQVWDGVLGCQHEWSSTGRVVTVGNNSAVRGASEAFATLTGGKAKAANDGNQRSIEAGRLCCRCNAWRGELGSEPSVDLYVRHLVTIFREIHRILRPDGSLWLNLGDSYNAYNGNAQRGGLVSLTQSDQRPRLPTGYGLSERSLPEKSLLGVPWRVAFALQEFGWVLRSDIVWAKPAPMPESTTDRCTRAHEYVFMLAKQSRYFFDAAAIRERATYAGKVVALGPKSLSKGQAAGAGVKPGGNALAASVTVGDGRNRRDVWAINTEQFPAAHFAVMPQALVSPCILAGSSHKACQHCGAPWRRVERREREVDPTVGHNALRGAGHMRESAGGPANREGREFLRVVASETTGWAPTCACADNTGASRSLVLDPFAGAGTVPLVAKLTGRDYLGIELNSEYCDLARRRIALFGRLGRGQPPPKAGEQAPPSLWDGVAMDGEGNAGTSEGERDEGANGQW